MGVWYTIDGQVRIKDNAETKKIRSRLRAECSSEISRDVEKHDDGTCTLSVSGGQQCAYTTATSIQEILEELSPHVTGEPAYFTDAADDEPGGFWVGDPAAVAVAKRVVLVDAARWAAKELTREEWLSLGNELNDKPDDFWAAVEADANGQSQPAR